LVKVRVEFPPLRATKPPWVPSAEEVKVLVMAAVLTQFSIVVVP
jgi:hypothetical protein